MKDFSNFDTETIVFEFQTLKWKKFPSFFIWFSESTWNRIAAADVYYSAGFFLTPPEGPDCMEKVAKFAADNNKVILILKFKIFSPSYENFS